MRNIYLLLLGLLFVIPTGITEAEDATTAMKRTAQEVAALELGFGDYLLGQKLTEQQKTIAQQNPIEKTVKGSYKFRDGEIYIIASIDNDVVIGLYKENQEASQEDVKTLVGELMMQFEEPTTMAHDKLIYWAFGKEGRISQNLFDEARQSGGKDVLATVKFSSDQPIMVSTKKEEGENEENTKKPVPTSVYVIISSNPLSKMFLALNK